MQGRPNTPHVNKAFNGDRYNQADTHRRTGSCDEQGIEMHRYLDGRASRVHDVGQEPHVLLPQIPYRRQVPPIHDRHAIQLLGLEQNVAGLHSSEQPARFTSTSWGVRPQSPLHRKGLLGGWGIVSIIASPKDKCMCLSPGSDPTSGPAIR